MQWKKRSPKWKRNRYPAQGESQNKKNSINVPFYPSIKRERGTQRGFFHTKNTMKHCYAKLGIILLIFFASACTTKGISSPTSTTTNDQIACQVLTDFLHALYAKNYEQAASLYGGTYEIMMAHNPTISPAAHSFLLKNACTINGAQCLEPRSIVLEEKISPVKFLFHVEFQNSDGSLFVQGPCCGGMEPKERSSFLFEVSMNPEGKFQVLNMPPYLP